MALLKVFKRNKAKTKKTTKEYPLVNGAVASYSQIKLAKNLGVDQQYINYKIGPYYADMLLVDFDLIIEYDGYFWHKDTAAKDLQRVKYFNSQGYKVLSILTDTIPPTAFVIHQANSLIHSRRLYKNVSYFKS